MSEEKGGGGKHTATKSRFQSPKHFFPVVVDDFFNDPEMIVDYGKSLQMEPDQAVRYQPGKRSKNLWEIDKILNENILLKIMSCYFDLAYMEFTWEASKLQFHEIPRFSENKNDVRNKGWIHQDNETYSAGKDDFELAGLIYLTPDIDPDSGTSLYNVKSTKSNKIYKTILAKDTLFKDGYFDKEEYTKSYIEHRECFSEKLRIYNIFNRLIMYDTREWHGANSYYNGDGKDARLTLGFFIGGISDPPLKRITKSEYESVIKLQIENWKI